MLVNWWAYTIGSGAYTIGPGAYIRGGLYSEFYGMAIMR